MLLVPLVRARKVLCPDKDARLTAKRKFVPPTNKYASPTKSSMSQLSCFLSLPLSQEMRPEEEQTRMSLEELRSRN